MARQVSLVHMTLPSLHSVSNHLTRTIIAYALPAQRDGLSGFRADGSTLADSGSGLRYSLASSSLRTAESSSSSYGLQVRLRLLSTPPHGDAVTFSFRERASPGRGLAPLGPRLLPGALAPPSTAARPRRPYGASSDASVEGGATEKSSCSVRIRSCCPIPCAPRRTPPASIPLPI
ncbi:MAG: hypothetical protein AB9866_18595 [Syntrophobacteraceae bacterium]